MRDKREHTGRRPGTLFAFWPLLFHCFIVFRHRRSMRRQQSLVCSLPVHSSLTPSLPCQYFLLVLLSTLRQICRAADSFGSITSATETSVENVHLRDPLNFNRESMENFLACCLQELLLIQLSAQEKIVCRRHSQLLLELLHVGRIRRLPGNLVV